MIRLAGDELRDERAINGAESRERAIEGGKDFGAGVVVLVLNLEHPL